MSTDVRGGVEVKFGPRSSVSGLRREAAHLRGTRGGVRGAISGREESLRDDSGVAAQIHGGRGGGVEAHDHGRGSGGRREGEARAPRMASLVDSHEQGEGGRGYLGRGMP
jgi:hypothetical protein